MPTETLRLGVDPREAVAGLSVFGSATKKATAGAFSLDKTIAGLAVSFGILGAARGIGAAVGAFMQWETALVGVSKTTDFTAAGLEAFGQQLRDLARDIPVTANELAGIAEVAGQLGIQEEHLLSFTQTMAALGVSTNLSATEAATALARFANIMGTSQGDFDRLASVIVDLGNNFATTEAEITNFALRMAGAGRTAGFAESDVLALGTALSSVGINAEAGGTAMQRVLNQMTVAAATANNDLALFARTAGLSAEDFQKKWGQDAAGAFALFVEGLANEGKAVTLALDELGIKSERTVRALTGLANGGDLLRNALKRGTIAADENIAATIEAEKFYGRLEGRLQAVKNRVTELASELGEDLGPKMVEGAENTLDFIDRLDQANKRILEFRQQLEALEQQRPGGPGIGDAAIGFLDDIGPVLRALFLDEMPDMFGRGLADMQAQLDDFFASQDLQQAMFPGGIQTDDTFMEAADALAKAREETAAAAETELETQRLIEEAERRRLELLEEARAAEDERVMLLGEALRLNVDMLGTFTAIVAEVDAIDAALEAGNLSLAEQVRLAANREALESSIEALIKSQEPTLARIGTHYAFIGTHLDDFQAKLMEVNAAIVGEMIPALELVERQVSQDMVDAVREWREGIEGGANDFKGTWITAISTVGNAVGGLGQDLAGIATAGIAAMGGPLGFLGGAGIALGGSLLGGLFGGGGPSEAEIALARATESNTAALDRLSGKLGSRADEIGEVDTLLGATQRVLGDLSFAIPQRGPGLGFQGRANEQRLESLGINIPDFIAAAEELGISIEQLTTDQLQAFAEALEFVKEKIEETNAAAADEFNRFTLGSALAEASGDDREVFRLNQLSEVEAQLAQAAELLAAGIIDEESFNAFEDALFRISAGSLADFDAAVEAAGEAAVQASQSFASSVEQAFLSASGDDIGARQIGLDIARADQIAKAIELGLEDLIPKINETFDLREQQLTAPRRTRGGSRRSGRADPEPERGDPITTSFENVSRAEAATLATLARSQLIVLGQIEINTRKMNPDRVVATERTRQNVASGFVAVR